MLNASEVALLERLVLGGLPASAGAAGFRRTRHGGAGLEFHEYRPYCAGDDPRSIDWTVEARLQQLVVRVARADGEARLHVLVDVSASMSLGTPSKLACAARLAAVLCYVAAARREPASLSTFDDGIRTHLPLTAGRSQLIQIFDALGRTVASGRSALDRALVSFGDAVRGPGLVVILSDFLEPDSRLAGVQSLLHRGLTPALVQIVAAEELAPELSEPTMLFDVEDPDAAPVVVDETAVAAFRARMSAHGEWLRGFCAGRGLPWLRLASHASFTELVSGVQRAGLLSEYA